MHINHAVEQTFSYDFIVQKTRYTLCARILNKIAEAVRKIDVKFFLEGFKALIASSRGFFCCH